MSIFIFRQKHVLNYFILILRISRWQEDARFSHQNHCNELAGVGNPIPLEENVDNILGDLPPPLISITKSKFFFGIKSIGLGFNFFGEPTVH